MTAASSSPFVNNAQSIQLQSVLKILLEPPLPLGRWLFVLGTNWLKSTSEAFDLYFDQRHHSTAEPETFSGMRRQNLDTDHLQQTSVIPNSAHWSQIRKLSYNIAAGVEQALKEWVMIAPNELSELRNYIQALSQNRVSDADAIALIQNLDRLPSSHNKDQPDVRGVIFPALLFPISGMREFLLQRTTLKQQQLEPLLGQTPEQKDVSSPAVEMPLPASFFLGSEPPSDPFKPEDSEDENALAKSEVAEDLSGYGLDEDSYDFDDEATQEEEDEIDEERLAAFERAIAKEEAEAEASRYDPKYNIDILALQEQWQQEQSRALAQKDPSTLEKAAKWSKRPSARKAKLTNAAQLVSALRECYGVTQEEFASIVGVRYNTINRWENAHAFPQALAIERLKQLTEALGDSGKPLLKQYFPVQQKQTRRKRK